MLAALTASNKDAGETVSSVSTSIIVESRSAASPAVRFLHCVCICTHLVRMYATERLAYGRRWLQDM